MCAVTKNHIQEVAKKIKDGGSTIPNHRAAFKAGYSFSHLPFSEQLTIWNYIWKNAHEHYMRIHAFFFIEGHMKSKEYLPMIWDAAVHWQDEATTWDLCDSLSKIFTRALELMPDKVYRQLAKWNKDKDPFKRRQSIVSLLYYSRTKKIYLPFDKIVALIKPLLTDKEYYVQKGVGWTLREMGNVYPGETMFFLKENISDISAIAFTAATEKLSQQEKVPLKMMRKNK